MREGHRREPFLLPLRHDEVDGFAIATGDIAKDFDAAFCPSMRALAVCLKPALIHIDKVLFATEFRQQAAQLRQITYAFFVISLRIPRRFFYAYQAIAWL